VKTIKKPIFVHYQSREPQRRKISYIKNEFKRIKRNCLWENDANEHIQKFVNTIRSNGYPWWIINETLRGLEDDEGDEIECRKQKDDREIFYLKFPFVNEKLNNDINKLSKKIGINIRCTNNNRNLNSLLRPRTRIGTRRQQCEMKHCTLRNKRLCFFNHIVYEATCLGCSKTYIGSTIRYLHVRVGEHMRNGALKEHSKTCNKTMKYDFKILCKCSDELDTRISEAQYIKQLKPSLNRKEEIIDSLCFL
jgi:hypothetical protein